MREIRPQWRDEAQGEKKIDRGQLIGTENKTEKRRKGEKSETKQRNSWKRKRVHRKEGERKGRGKSEDVG